MRTLLRLSPALLILAGLLGAYATGVWHAVSWQGLAARQEELRLLVRTRPAVAMGGFLAAYVAIVACSLPVAALVTVTGGYLFGPPLGALLAVLGATCGASVVFFAVRGALGPWLERRAEGLLAWLGPRLRRDGLSYVLALRLLPVVPFWLVNIAGGLSGISWRVFALGTLLGVAPASLVFSGLGSGIAGVLASGATPDLTVILSAPVLLPLLGLAGLALLPVVWRQWKGRDGRV